MMVRIPVLIILMTILYGSGMLLLDKFDAPIVLSENPLQLASQMAIDGRMEEVLYLAQFSHQYLPVDEEFSYQDLEYQAKQALASNWTIAEHFAVGALTGEVTDSASLFGTLALDLLVIGDIRDLLVQGYKEFDSGQGDEVIIGLSAVGLFLTIAPELSWVPSMFKAFWRGKRFSEPFQRRIRTTVSKARKSGNTTELRVLMVNFSDVINRLGIGSAMKVMKRVESSEDLALLAVKAKIAPVETYTLVSTNGIKSLQHVSTINAKKGKLLKRVKLASRQQKLFGKAFAIVPAGWLVIVFFVTLLMFFYTLLGRKKSF